MHTIIPRMHCHQSPKPLREKSTLTPTLFKDARKFVLSCDECQRIGNISRRQEMPMNYSLVIEPFDVWGFDYMGPFPASNGYTYFSFC